MVTTEINRKKAAEDMAEVIAASGLKQPGIMEQLRAFNITAEQPSTGNSQAASYIGIWKEDAEEQQYIRDKKQMADWVRWADQNKIPFTTTKKRILLTGESVARGSFYGNECTPARMLEHILGKAAGEHKIEVVDIAKSGMELDELTALLQKAAVLHPDQVVIIAGNNFFYKLYKDFLTATPEYNHINELTDEWLKKCIDKALEQFTISFLQDMQRIFVSRNVPVLFVVPAFNLSDWKVTMLEKLPPSLPTTALARWNQLQEAAGEALAAQHYAELEKAATAMLKLCPVHPAPYELLGEAAMARQDWGAAKKYLEDARDHTLLFKSIGKPRILSVVRNTLLTKAAAFGVQVTDLAGVFEQQPGNLLSGRNLFMDYCHMNIEAIRISMAAIAGAIAPAMGIGATDLQQLETYANEMQPTPEAACMAHIYAAIHNAHYGQGYTIVKYHFESAFAYCEALAARFCRLYIEMATARLSSPLTRAFTQMLDDVDIRIDQYPEAVFHPVNGKLLDIVLTDAMNDMLAEKGMIEPQMTAALRLAEHAVENGTVNLLESFYSRHTYDSNYNDGAQFYKSRDSQSEFVFFTHAKSSLVCELVYRVKSEYADPIKITLNGKPLTDLPPASKWQPGFLKIDRHLLAEGQNRLCIIWPPYEHTVADDEISSINDVINMLTPVRGELHSFSIWA